MPSSSLTASCGHWAWYAKYSLPVLTIRILVPPSTMNSFMPLRGTSSSRHTRLHMRTNLPWLVAAPIPASAPALEDRNDDFPERHHNPPSPLPPVPPSVHNSALRPVPRGKTVRPTGESFYLGRRALRAELWPPGSPGSRPAPRDA